MVHLDHPMLQQFNNLPHHPALDTTLVQTLVHLAGKIGVQKLQRIAINSFHPRPRSVRLARARHMANNIASPWLAMTLMPLSAAI
jgi:hypothetical protein